MVSVSFSQAWTRFVCACRGNLITDCLTPLACFLYGYGQVESFPSALSDHVAPRLGWIHGWQNLRCDHKLFSFFAGHPFVHFSVIWKLRYGSLVEPLVWPAVTVHRAPREWAAQTISRQSATKPRESNFSSDWLLDSSKIYLMKTYKRQKHSNVHNLYLKFNALYRYNVLF